MRTGITPLTSEKMIIALQLHDAIDNINTALKARKAALILNYTDHTLLKLQVEMPDAKPGDWMVTNPRARGICRGAWPADPDLAAIARDITERLYKLNAYLAIGVTLNKDRQKIAKLQIFFLESKRMAITLAETKPRTKNRTNIFEPPKGFQ